MNSHIIQIKVNTLKRHLSLLDRYVKIESKEKDCYICKVHHDILKKLDEYQIPYQIIRYYGVNKYIQYLKKNLSFGIGLIVFVMVLFFNSLTIKEISFNTDTTDNDEIETIIRGKMHRYFGFNFFTGELNDLNLELKKEFNDYEWISVKRTGSKLDVIILKPTIMNKRVEVSDNPGDLVATKDGIIKKFIVEHGVVLVHPDQYVKKGQVLVSGNLRINSNIEEPFYIPANGEVYAQVWYEKSYVIKEEQVETSYSGKIITNKSLSIGGFDIKYKRNQIYFEQYDKEVEEEKLKIFNISLPFSLKKIHYYEKSDIIKTYDEKSAFEYAYSSAKYDVSQEYEQGKILEIKTVKQEKTADGYEIKFLVVTEENIAKFKRSTLDE